MMTTVMMMIRAGLPYGMLETRNAPPLPPLIQAIPCTVRLRLTRRCHHMPACELYLTRDCFVNGYPPTLPRLTLMWTAEKILASWSTPPCRKAVHRPMRAMDGSVYLAMSSPDRSTLTACVYVARRGQSGSGRGIAARQRRVEEAVDVAHQSRGRDEHDERDDQRLQHEDSQREIFLVLDEES